MEVHLQWLQAIHGCLINNWSGVLIVVGDFNSIGTQFEKIGSFIDTGAILNFKNYITNADITKMPSIDRNFTWSNRDYYKFMQDWQYFCFRKFLEDWPNAYYSILPTDLSDHRPLISKDALIDFGLIPFKLFNSWIYSEDFKELVEKEWSYDFYIWSTCKMTNLKNNLKMLKYKIRKW